jgi:hypothetical protein
LTDRREVGSDAELACLARAVRSVLVTPSGVGDFQVLLRYLILVIKRPAPAIARLLGTEVGPDAEEPMTTIDELWNLEPGKRERVRAEEYLRVFVEERAKVLAEDIAEERIKEAYAKGTAEGQRTMLLRQLIARFGTLPAALEVRIREASSADLEVFAERVLSAATLEDVFR